jgi:hypothetical protein
MYVPAGKRRSTQYLLGWDQHRRLLDKNGEEVTLCDPNAKDQQGFTPFHHAVAWADKDVLLWCMRYAAGWAHPWRAAWALGKRETRLDAVNDAGETALIIAAKRSNLVVISLLCDVYHYRSRPDVAISPLDGGEDERRSRDTIHVLNMRDATGRTALSHCCAGHYETIVIVRKLLDAVRAGILLATRSVSVHKVLCKRVFFCESTEEGLLLMML